MYEFRPILPRIERMRVRVRDRLIVADSEKAALKLEAIKAYMAYPPMLKKPYMSLYVISRMPLNIQDEDYFVGDMGNRGWGAADGSKWLMADIENTWPIEADGLITPRTPTRSTPIRSWPLRRRTSSACGTSTVR